MRTVEIVKDHLPQNQINICLRSAITLIGCNELQKKNKKDNSDPFKTGLTYIDRRLHKRHKTALRNLTRAKPQKYSYPGKTKTQKYIWRINRKKAPRIFCVLYDLLNDIDPNEIEAVFEAAYKQLKQFGVENRGDSLIAFPYYIDVISTEELSMLARRIKPFEKYCCVRAQQESAQCSN